MRTPARLVVDGRPTAQRIRRAERWWSRAVGLLGTRRLADDQGLWLAPCASVHTVGMAYAIDVVFVAAAGEVLKVVPALPAWRASACRGAACTLELPAGAAARLGIAAGGRLALVAG